MPAHARRSYVRLARLLSGAWLTAALLSATQAHAQAKDATLRSAREELARCIPAAAQYHHVNPAVLAAILKVESSFNPGAVNKNRNGTVDVGVGQINSIHFPRLRAYGIGSDHLHDACAGTYIAAWHLSGQIKRYGNNWFAVASYHSATPCLNERYGKALWKTLRAWGEVRGDWPVPSDPRCVSN